MILSPWVFLCLIYVVYPHYTLASSEAGVQWHVWISFRQYDSCSFACTALRVRVKRSEKTANQEQLWNGQVSTRHIYVWERFHSFSSGTAAQNACGAGGDETYDWVLLHSWLCFISFFWFACSFSGAFFWLVSSSWTLRTVRPRRQILPSCFTVYCSIYLSIYLYLF